MKRNTYYTTPGASPVIPGVQMCRTNLHTLPAPRRWYYRLVALIRRSTEESIYRERLLKRLAEQLAVSSAALTRTDDGYLDEGFFRLVDEVRDVVHEIRTTLTPVFHGLQSDYLRFLVRDTVPAADRSFQTAVRTAIDYLKPQVALVEDLRRQVTDGFEHTWTAYLPTLEEQMAADWHTYVALGMVLEFPISTIDAGVPTNGTGQRSLPVRAMTPVLLELYRLFRFLDSAVNETTLRRMDRFFDVHGAEAHRGSDALRTESSGCRRRVERLLATLRRMELLSLIRLGLWDPLARVEPIRTETSQAELTRQAYDRMVRRFTVRYAMQKARLQVEPIVIACAGPAGLDHKDADALVAERIGQLPPEVAYHVVGYLLTLVAGSRFDGVLRTLFDAIVAGFFPSGDVASTIHGHISILDQHRAHLHALFFTGVAGEGEAFHMLRRIQRTNVSAARRSQKISMQLDRVRDELIRRVWEITDAMVVIAETLDEVDHVPRGALSVSSWSACAAGLRNLLVLETEAAHYLGSMPRI